MANSDSQIPELLVEGTLRFAIEGRMLRELGEHLVRTPEVAIVELIKNSYDADATECVVSYYPPESIVVSDDGLGMTQDQFLKGWMRIGTSIKENISGSEKYSRHITGEKGIGRFAVRFLGRSLTMETVAIDVNRDMRTKLVATFDWPRFDHQEDLGSVEVPYHLERVNDSVATGTKLEITDLRSAANNMNLNVVRTGSIGVLSPLRSMFRQLPSESTVEVDNSDEDPGFDLKIRAKDETVDEDIASQILGAYVLRATLKVRGDRYKLRISRSNESLPQLEIVDTYPNEIGTLDADVRFFPRRAGTFTNMPLDGRKAQRWITENHGIAVFDRGFRVPPYGFVGNDWLSLQSDAARNRRDPRSSLARKHFEMTQQVRADTALNWMLRIPHSLQLVGLVQVHGGSDRNSTMEGSETGLIASADRQGFLENKAFNQLRDLARGTVEAIAFVDRKLQLEEAEEERRETTLAIRIRTRAAIEEIEGNATIPAKEKRKIISALVETESLAVKQQESIRQREQHLEVMSLLGVVAGYMTHEFGAALDVLKNGHRQLVKLKDTAPKIHTTANQLGVHIKQLQEFVAYSTGYIRGARNMPKKPYPVRPRLRQVSRIFGKYAAQRNIELEIDVDENLEAPLVPVSLYNGVALNLYSNALKAVTAKLDMNKGRIAFRAWNEGRWHFLEVSDNGIGIPSALRERVFEPLFNTTYAGSSPLGTGMGLGLAFVRRSVDAFGGSADVVDAPAGFSTCLRVKLPLLVQGVNRDG